MKKRLFVVIILLLALIFATNTLWLPRVPVDINFNILGENNAEIKVSLGSSKYDEKNVNLKTDNKLFFQVKKKGAFNVVKISMNLQSAKDSIYISNVKMLNNSVFLNDLNKFEADDAKLSINKDTLIITPNSNSVNLKYPIKANPFVDFNLVIFLLIAVLGGGIFAFLLFPEVRKYLKSFVISDEINRVILLTSIIITVFLFSIFLLSFLGFIFHIPINKFYPIVSLFLSLGVTCFYSKKYQFSSKQCLFLIGFLILTLVLSVIFSLYFYDYSYDGRAYHQGSIILLMNGWNPVFEKGLNDIIPYSVWSECYPKLAEILQANFALLANNIEFGKIVNFFFAFNLFYLALFALSTFKNIKDYNRILVALLIVLNPVCICQIKTFYVDLFVYYIFTTFVMLFILSKTKAIENKMFLFLVISNATMLCNVKLGGIFYTILFLLAYLLFSCIKKSKQDLLNSLVIITFSTVLVLLSGINPYFTNIKQGEHPFYPVMGEHKVDVMTLNSPKEFKNKNSLYKLFYSTFSKTANILQASEKKVTLKFPFDLIRQDSFAVPDMRIAGWGYLWSGILILSLILLFLTKKSKDENKNIYYFVMSLLWASILLNPEAWWARYAPQFWLIPIFILLWRLNNVDLKQNYKVFAYVILALMFVNILMIDFKNIETSTSYKAEISDFYRQTKGKTLLVYFEKDEQGEEMADYPFYKKLEIENETKCLNVDANYYLAHKSEFRSTPRYLKDTIKWSIKDE